MELLNIMQVFPEIFFNLGRFLTLGGHKPLVFNVHLKISVCHFTT